MSIYTNSQTVSKATYFNGYHEKASNAYLDDFYANAGHNNWTRFGRDCCMNAMMRFTEKASTLVFSKKIEV